MEIGSRDEVPHVTALVRSRRQPTDLDHFGVVERVLHDIERQGER